MTDDKSVNHPGDLIPGFDLDDMRLPQNYGEALGVKRHIINVPVRKPIKTEFFRTRPGEEWRLQTMILELKQEREIYLLAPAIWDVVPELVRPAVLHVAINQKNNVFLIPVPLPGQEGRRNTWHQSLANIVVAAESKWVRCVANMDLGSYDMLVAAANQAEPEWPEITFGELLQIAFRDRFIESPDHPVIKQLLGR